MKLLSRAFALSAILIGFSVAPGTPQEETAHESYLFVVKKIGDWEASATASQRGRGRTPAMDKARAGIVVQRILVRPCPTGSLPRWAPPTGCTVVLKGRFEYELASTVPLSMTVPLAAARAMYSGPGTMTFPAVERRMAGMETGRFFATATGYVPMGVPQRVNLTVLASAYNPIPFARETSLAVGTLTVKDRTPWRNLVVDIPCDRQ